MSAGDGYDVSADLLSVLRADRAGQRLAARLGPADGGTGEPAAWLKSLDGMVHSGLKVRLLHGGGVFTTVNPDGLSQALDASPRFRRDSRLGNILHQRKISFREVSRTDSLHVIIDGNRVSTHIDRVSPLNCHPGQSAHYSLIRILAHNAAGVADLLAVRFQRGHPRSDTAAISTK